MTRREQFLFNKVVHELQMTTKHMPLNMNPEDAFNSSKNALKADLLVMIDMLERVDFNWFEPFMIKTPLTPPPDRL